MNRFIICISVLLALTGCSGKGPVLHLVTSLDPMEASEYIYSFEKDTGIKVKWIRLSAGEVIARISAEEENPSMSVWFGGPALEFIEAKSKGFFLPYIPKDADKIEKRWRDKEGYWTGIYLGSIAFASNKNFLEKNKLEAPQKWEDLLKPEFKNQIAVSLPYTAGTGYTVLAGLVSAFGEKEAFNYYKKLGENLHHYTKSGSAPVVEAGLGEVGVGIAFVQDILRKGSRRGFPLVMTQPEVVPFEVGGVAIIKGAPEAELAKKFVDWIISLNAQNLMQKFARLPVRSDADQPKGVKTFKELKLAPVNLEYMGKNRAEILARWRKEFGK